MAPGAPLEGLSHLDLSVTDRHESARWYADVLGFEIRGDRFNQAAQLHWIHLVHPCGLSMGLIEHPDNPGEPFDERRSGLDHVSFAVPTPDAVDLFAHRAIEHGGAKPVISQSPHAVVLVLRDPDHIQLEICYWKATDQPNGVPEGRVGE
jgi:glyoxylase I family protein